MHVRALAFAALIAAVVAVGCGGDDGEERTEPSTGPSATPQERAAEYASEVAGIAGDPTGEECVLTKATGPEKQAICVYSSAYQGCIDGHKNPDPKMADLRAQLLVEPAEVEAYRAAARECRTD